jgi:hypothetical protein
MATGKLTVRAARTLSQELAGQGLEVLFDHGDKDLDSPNQLGRIVSWFGPEYAQAAELAMIDIAVVLPRTRAALALIEVEEGGDNPKTILGDALGTLLGEHITFQGTRQLLVGPGTTLVILARTKAESHARRMDYLERRLATLKPALRTANAAIGRVVLGTFEDYAGLEATLIKHVREALAAAQRR